MNKLFYTGIAVLVFIMAMMLCTSCNGNTDKNIYRVRIDLTTSVDGEDVIEFISRGLPTFSPKNRPASDGIYTITYVDYKTGDTKSINRTAVRAGQDGSNMFVTFILID
jgi:hypothetical protein